MPGEFVFVERAPREMPGLGDEGVLDARRPPEGVRRAKKRQLRASREGAVMRGCSREHPYEASAADDFTTWIDEVSASAGSASLMRRKVASACPTIWSM